jgi:hypothetical protein
MPNTNSAGQTVHEQVVISEHPHQGVLDGLPGRTDREQRRPLRLPRVPDRIPPSESLPIPPISVRGKISGHENPRRKLSDFDLRGGTDTVFSLEIF